MSKFKVGDRVQLRDCNVYVRGEISKIIYDQQIINKRMYAVWWDGDTGSSFVYYEHHLELCGKVFMVWNGKVNREQ